jgi:tellurite resistance protein
MFLAELQPEEKKAFLELASLIAMIDGNLSIFENSILRKYQKEMKLENYRIKDLAIEDILKIFKNERSKHIVLTEVFKLIYSDGVFHDEESKSVQLIKVQFGFDPNEYGSFKDWVFKIKELSIPEGEL